MSITPEELLNNTAIGNGFHLWGVEGGRIQVTTEELEPVLQEAYDSHADMEQWYCMISWDEEDGWHVS